MRATLVVTALACAVSGGAAASPPDWSGGTTQALLTAASGGESQAELTITPSDGVTGMDLKMSWEVRLYLSLAHAASSEPAHGTPLAQPSLSLPPPSLNLRLDHHPFRPAPLGT